MKGQALVTLLFFAVIALTITASGAAMIMANSISGTKVQQGSITYDIALSGIENAELRLLRNPSYTGETLPVGEGNAIITVTAIGNSYTILSKGVTTNIVRKIQVNATYNNNQLSITSQQEVF